MGYPIAYLITFTTYGTWMHGDKRGSVDKRHNRYGSEFVSRDLARNRKARSALKTPPFFVESKTKKGGLECNFAGMRKSWVGCACGPCQGKSHPHCRHRCGKAGEDDDRF